MKEITSEEESKIRTVGHLVSFIKQANEVRRASQPKGHEQDLSGPLFTFLVGAGFSLSCGLPTTEHLVCAIEKYKKLSGQQPKWMDVLEETKADRYPSHPEKRITDYYSELIERELMSPSARQDFCSSVVRWARQRKDKPQINPETKLLAVLLYNGSLGPFKLREPASPSKLLPDDDLYDPEVAEWLPKAFARHVFTTNFDDVIPSTFYYGNLPIDIVDTPGLRALTYTPNYPTVTFLHGRYLHYDIRNTPSELLHRFISSGMNHKDLFQQFREILRSTSLIVIGYSGGNDRVTEAIIEALNDPDSMNYNLWWSAFDINSVDQRIRDAIQVHPRAFYLERDADASTLMTRLCSAIDIDVKSAEDWWKKEIEKVQKGLGTEFEDIIFQQYYNKTENAVSRGSKSELALPLIEEWQAGFRDKVTELKNKSFSASIKRFVAILMVHNGSFKRSKGEDDENLLNEGYDLIRQAINEHQDMNDDAQLADDYLHLGAYESKRKDKFHENNIKFESGRGLYDEAKSNLEEALRLFRTVGRVHSILKTKIWIARNEIYNGDRGKGCRQLRDHLNEAQKQGFLDLIRLVKRHLRRECSNKRRKLR